MEFSDDERAYLNEMRKLSTDNAGNEIFVGLTVEESEEYYRFTRLSYSYKGDHEELDRAVKLGDKHEAARFTVLGAEMSARDDKSPATK